MTRELRLMPMRPSIPWIIAACALVAAGCQPGPAPLSDADRQAIQAVSEQFMRHIESGNVDSLAALYTEDVVVMPPNQPAVHGRAAVREWQADFPPVSEFIALNDEIQGVGDLAYVRGRYVLRLAIEGAPVDSGKYLEIRRRQADGSWPIAVDIFNSSLPAPAPRAN